MKLLIVGATSMLGRAVVDILGPEVDVVTAGRRDADLHFDLLHPIVAEPKGLRVDTTLILAADFGGTSIEDGIRAFQANVIGASNACVLSARAEARHVILVSSASAVYQPNDYHYGPYSVSKKHGEEAASLVCASTDQKLTILRPTAIYDQNGLARRHQRLFYSIVDAAKEGREFVISGRNDVWRNFLFVKDMARVISAAIVREPGGTHLCRHPTSSTIIQMIETAASVFRSRARYSFAPELPNIPSLPEFTSNNIFDELGIAEPIDMRAGFELIRDAN